MFCGICICYFSLLGQSLWKRSNSSLLKASAGPFSFEKTCFAYTWMFCLKHSRVIILMSTMQFLHFNEELLIIYTALSLSQYI